MVWPEAGDQGKAWGTKLPGNEWGGQYLFCILSQGWGWGEDMQSKGLALESWEEG